MNSNYNPLSIRSFQVPDLMKNQSPISLPNEGEN